MTANMNFGPEWMRGGFSQRSNTTSSQSTQSMLSPQTLTSNFTSNKENNFVSSPSIDNPYKYSKEFMLSLYCPSAPPQQFEHLPYVAVEESLGPLAFVDLSEEERKLLAGPVHSESSRRVVISNDKGNGQRHHRNDYHSTDINRSMNRSKGRHGLEHQHRRVASSQSDFDGSKQTDSYVDNNSSSSSNNNNNNSGNNNLWGGGNDSLGSWDSHRNGNNHSSTLDKGWGNRPENNESVSAGWNNRSENNENESMGWTPTNSGSNGTSFNSSTENGFKSAIDGASFGEPGSVTAEKSPSQYKWYYRDPSSNVQGPFDAQEMQDWYKAGFFGPSLWIRREDQDQFEPLAALVLKVGSEDALFLSPIPKRPDFSGSFGAGAAVPTPSAATPAFPPSSDSFPRMGTGNIFGNSTGPDLLPSGIGNKYSPFGNMLNSTPGPNGSLPMASPFSGVNPFGPAFGRDPGTAPSWLNNSHPDFFGNNFQRQQQQQQQQQQQHMMNPLFQNRNMSSFNNEPMDIQQHFMSVLQRQQQQQHQQHDMGLSDQSLSQQPLFGQNQVLERLSNHASPVIRPAALSGWGSSPGTPLTTEAPSSPWGSIVSPAIPHKVADELQSKAPGQQSPRSHLSPQIHHSTLPTTNNNSSITSTTVSTAANSTTTTTPTTPTTSTSPKTSSKFDIINNDENNFTTTTATATLNESRWDKKSNKMLEENTTSLKKVSLHEIQQEQEQEQEKNRKKEQEILKKQKEKELAEANTKQKSEKVQTPPTAATATEATPIHPKRMPEVPTVKPMSLREIQAEELKRQEELKKQAKANKVTKPTPSAASPTSTKAGWNSGSGWNSESFKGPSLREIQEMEAKEAKLKKEAERKAAELQQQTFTSSTSSTVSATTSTTLSWGVVTPSKSQSGTHSNSSTSAAATVAWSSTSAPKKTLREIQLEEEAAMKKKANKQQQQQQQQQQAINTKVGYANVASKVVDTFDDASWTTVHNKPKPSSNTTTSTTSTTSSAKNGWDIVGAPKKPAVINSGATSISRTMVMQPAKKSANGPSEGFKLWCKQSLRDLNAGVNADEILKMLLSFPLDNSVNEIIQDIIYANSTSMDGRRFAAEFMKRRRADINNNDKVTPTVSSTIVPPINTAEDDTFQVVNKKGRKTKAV
ncbi:hypothetical protein BJ944DRAFT_269618 [Cunninghamella echinulata]|nr:hypothetical protein BJ944DRAFT_269618 [Cunninghamella echinulata]